MANWVDDGTSSYTVGDTGGRGFSGHEILRRAGATSLIVLPLLSAGTRLGLLLVADRANRAPDVEAIEFLELLALQAAVGLRTSVASAPPRDVLPERAGVVLVDGGPELTGALRAVVAGGGTVYQTGASEFVLAFAPDSASSAEVVGRELRTKLGVPVGVAVGVVGEPGEAVLRRARGSLI